MKPPGVVVVLVAVGCAGSPPPPPAPHRDRAAPTQATPARAAPRESAAPAPRSAISIDAPGRVTWTGVASGALEPTEPGDTTDPLLATALSGRVFAAVVKSHEIALRIIRAEDHGKHDTIAIVHDAKRRTHRAAVALNDRVAKAIVYSTDGDVITATVDLATAAVVQANFRLESPHVVVDQIYRVGDGWVLVGSRRFGAGGGRGDLVAWELADGARALLAITLVADANDGCEYESAGTAAPDGTIVLTAVPGRESCRHPTRLVLTRRRGQWANLNRPFTHVGARILSTPDSQWFIDCVSCGDEPRAFVAGTAEALARKARPTELEARWAGHAHPVHAIAAPSRVMLYGGAEALGDDTAPLVLDSSRGPTGGAIYELGRGTVRPFASPDLAQLPAARWSPDLAIAIGDQLCLLGGRAAGSAAHREVDLHGAACLDPETLTWQWHAAPAELPLRRDRPVGGDAFVGSSCEMIGQVDATATLVWCASRRSSAAEGDTYRWGLWLVGLAR